MFYSNTYKKRLTAQRLICYYDLFSQIIRLKKAKSKLMFLCCSAASGTSHAYVLLLLATFHKSFVVQSYIADNKTHVC